MQRFLRRTGAFGALTRVGRRVHPDRPAVSCFPGLRCGLLGISIAVCSVPTRGLSQSSPRVSVGDVAYEALDVLVGGGLVRTSIYGQKPYTRAEFARMLVESRRASTARTLAPSTMRVLARLEQEFARDVRALDTSARRTGDPALAKNQDTKPGWYDAWTNSMSVEMLVLASPLRAIPATPLGSVHADVNPLLNARAGRRYGDGATVAADWRSAWVFGNRLVVSMQPRIAAGGKNGARFVQGRLEEGSVALRLRNIEIDVGRQPLVWGQGADGGLLLSTSGRPLDMIRVSTLQPWRAPWVFRYLGLLRGTAFIADLGASQNFPHAKVAAYKLSGAVTSYFELAALVLAHEGGKGAPRASLFERIVDLVPGVEYTLPEHLGQFSNKFAGFETRVRVPALHNLRLYTEHMFDDVSELGYATLWQDGGHIVGASLAQVGHGGALSLVGEFHHTGLRFFQHTPFTSGLAFNRTLLGDALGPQGDGGYLRMLHDAGRNQRWQLSGAIERRGGDDYFTPPEDFRFVLQTHRPSEWRHRATLQWSTTRKKQFQLSLLGGVEHVRDASFIAGASRTNAVVAAKWSWAAW